MKFNKSKFLNELGLILAIIVYIILNFGFQNFTPSNLNNFAVLSFTFFIFIIMLYCAFNIVRHADWLAEKFGEPYGTLILTLSVISIEVALIITMMFIGKGDPTLARDTMFAVIMIAINGFAGLSLLTGGLKHKQQLFNIEGASAYLAVLIPLITICLILPNYTKSTSEGTFSSAQSFLVIGVSIVLYVTFLIKQTITHQDYFKFSIEIEEEKPHDDEPAIKTFYHIIALVIGLIVMILLSKNLSLFLDFSIEKVGLPSKLGGFLVALLVLAPEGVCAIQSAYRDQLQRSINLCMGSAVATICLTVPAVLIISQIMNQSLILGMENTSMVIMILTFLISMITFSAKKTNVLYGMVLLSTFAIYFSMLFD